MHWMLIDALNELRSIHLLKVFFSFEKFMWWLGKKAEQISRTYRQRHLHKQQSMNWTLNKALNMDQNSAKSFER